jgi:hypothetical protein
MSDELVTTTTTTKAQCYCLYMFVNISCIPSLIEDEELKLSDQEISKLSPIELEPWFEDEDVISK